MMHAAFTVFLIALTASAALASQPGQLTLRNWHSMDRCARDARAAFPDFTAEANAKRDAFVKACLAGGNLPPREPLTPSH
jgi:hypothetical protein